MRAKACCVGFSLIACGARTGLDLHIAEAGVLDGAVPDSAPPARCMELGDSPFLVSRARGGGPSAGIAGSPTISRDGRVVAYVSSASDLVDGDTNEDLDVFVFDRRAGTTTRASVATDGSQGDDASGFRLITGRPSLSADGTLVAFPSNSDLLHPDDDNGRTDIYLHSMRTGETWFVRYSDERFVGGDSPVLARDGRFVTFAPLLLTWSTEETIAAFQIVRYDLETGESEPASVTDEGRFSDAADDYLFGVGITERVLSISADGRFVAFASGSQNLEAVDDTNADIFVRDMTTGTTQDITDGANDASFGPSLSADGRYLAFTTAATNLGSGRDEPGIVVADRESGTIESIPNAAGFPTLSEDARFVSFVRDRRVGVHDRLENRSELVVAAELADDEILTRPVLSGDGCWVTFLWSVGSDTQVWVARNPLR